MRALSPQLVATVFVLTACAAFFLAWIAHTTPTQSARVKQVNTAFILCFLLIGLWAVYCGTACVIAIAVGHCVGFPLFPCPW